MRVRSLSRTRCTRSCSVLRLRNMIMYISSHFLGRCVSNSPFVLTHVCRMFIRQPFRRCSCVLPLTRRYVASLLASAHGEKQEHQRERWTATTGSGDHETRSHEVGYDDGGDDARAEVVKGISQSTDKAEGGEKNSPGNGKRMELGHGDILQERHESKSKINRVKSHADIAGTDEAEQRRMIQRAYRKWLDRKKKQARSERQAEKERDKQAETRRSVR